MMKSRDLSSLLWDAMNRAMEASCPTASSCEGVTRQTPEGAKHAGSQTCQFLETCGFFKKYHTRKNLACRGFIKMYCIGAKQGECKRKQYRIKHGVPPPDDMLPSGQMVAMSGSDPDHAVLPGTETKSANDMPMHTQGRA